MILAVLGVIACVIILTLVISDVFKKERDDVPRDPYPHSWKDKYR